MKYHCSCRGRASEYLYARTWIWDAACTIQGATDAPEFKDFILPLGVFFKRLSDAFEDEFGSTPIF
jgi:hypothetical protein